MEKWSSHQSHNLGVTGSNPVTATQGVILETMFSYIMYDTWY